MKLVLGQLRFVYVSQEQREPPNYFEMVADCNRFIHSVDLAQRTVLFLDIAGTEACHKMRMSALSHINKTPLASCSNLRKMCLVRSQ